MRINFGRSFIRRYSTEVKGDNKNEYRYNKRFIDQLRIYARGGTGGQGYAKYGGVGGKGGDVFLQSSKKATLKEIKAKNPNKRFIAKNGGNSGKHVLVGDTGENLILKVPLGVTVQNDTGREIADLNEEGQQFLLAEGGTGGNPGNNFLGKKGQATVATLVLKLIADIGLVGFPNAGKSTVLASISRASPKIADIPFTTLKPQIGTMMYTDHRQITVADLPGLIEGAHVNYGLGHKFLRHIERTKLLLFVVDIFGFQLKPEHAKRTAFETILLLNKELELYREDLLDKPAVLALNKADQDENHVQAEKIIDQIKNIPESLSSIPEELHPERLVEFEDIFVISAQKKQGTEEMQIKLREILDKHSEQQNYTQLALKMKETEMKVERAKEYNTGRLV